MKDSKFSYTAVRIYNTDLIEELEKTFNRTETSFASNRSQFLVHLIELGLGSYKETLEGKRSMPNEKPFDLPTDIEDLRDLLDKYITYSRDQNKKSGEKLEVCESITSAILNILLASLNGDFIDKEACDAGKYDEVHKRFKKKKEAEID